MGVRFIRWLKTHKTKFFYVLHVHNSFHCTSGIRWVVQDASHILGNTTNTSACRWQKLNVFLSILFLPSIELPDVLVETAFFLIYLGEKATYKTLVWSKARSTEPSSSRSPSSSEECVGRYSSTGRMPLASSIFLRLSSHWVNCLDSRNICQSHFKGSVGGAFVCSWSEVSETRCTFIYSGWRTHKVALTEKSQTGFTAKWMIKALRCRLSVSLIPGDMRRQQKSGTTWSSTFLWLWNSLCLIFWLVVESFFLPFCCIPQKASLLPATELQFGPVKDPEESMRDTHAHARTHARTHTHTHTLTCSLMWIWDRRCNLVACSGTSVNNRNTCGMMSLQCWGGLSLSLMKSCQGNSPRM